MARRGKEAEEAGGAQAAWTLATRGFGKTYNRLQARRRGAPVSPWKAVPSLSGRKFLPSVRGSPLLFEGPEEPLLPAAASLPFSAVKNFLQGGPHPGQGAFGMRMLGGASVWSCGWGLLASWTPPGRAGDPGPPQPSQALPRSQHRDPHDCWRQPLGTARDPGEGPGCSGTGKCCLSPSQGLPAMGLAKYPTARPYPQGQHRGSRKGVGLGGFYSSQLMLCSQGQVFEDTQIREGGETNSKEFSC